MILLKTENISKFIQGFAGTGQLILEDVNFEIDAVASRMNITALLAPFGAGKTTLLKILAAVDFQTNGKVYLSGNEYKTPDGSIAYIPEEPSSFPWLNVTKNIEFALKLKNKNYDTEKLKVLISFVGLTGYEDHYPDNKSLGFRFRISLARALAVEPKLILLDDPLKNLFGETKKEIKFLIKKTAEDFKVPLLISTTNISEALELSSLILLMKKHPGTIIDSFKINRQLISAKEDNYFAEIRQKIENSLSLHENSMLALDAGNR